MALIGTQRVLVTGATSGIGLAIATRLLESGSRVVLVGRDLKKIESLLGKYPTTAFGLSRDLRDIAQVEAVAQEAHERMKGIDGIVHGAGVIRHNALRDVSDDELSEQIETNLLAPIRLTKVAFPLIEEGGAILFLSSTLSQRPICTSSIYSATKGGLDAFMRAVAIEGAPRRIRSNSLVLGMVDTPMIAQGRPGQGTSLEAVKTGFSGLHLLEGLGQPGDVAEVGMGILAAPWMTGSQIVLDGGLLLKG